VTAGAVIAGAAVGNAGADDVPADGAVLGALGDVEVLVGAGVGRDDEAEAALLGAVGADELVAARLLAGQQDVAAPAVNDPALTNQVVERLAELGVVIFVVVLELPRQLARLEALVVVGLQVLDDLILQLF